MLEANSGHTGNGIKRFYDPIEKAKETSRIEPPNPGQSLNNSIMHLIHIDLQMDVDFTNRRPSQTLILTAETQKTPRIMSARAPRCVAPNARVKSSVDLSMKTRKVKRRFDPQIIRRLMAVISIIQRRFYTSLGGVAISIGTGWRFASEYSDDTYLNTLHDLRIHT
jgi:hypothetical protein